ncbi:MAG: MmcQ/YjbR family DNA-binding protein [Actinomycetota bacterium]
MVTADDIRACALALPRTTEHLIRDQVKFRVGRIVYVALSPDETIVGFGFPKEERAALIAAEPAKFSLPRLSDQRFHWVHAQLAELSVAEMRGLVTDAWRMVVPKFLAAAQLAADGDGAGGAGGR